jgi:hypothetical protein
VTNRDFPVLGTSAELAGFFARACLCKGVLELSGLFRGLCLCPRNSVSRKQRFQFEETPFPLSGLRFNLGRLDSGAKFVVGLLSGYSGLAEAPKRALHPRLAG